MLPHNKREIKMKIEKQICSLELSKQLKEVGYKQEGLWWWEISPSKVISEIVYGNKNYFRYEYYTAPTVAELIYMLTELRQGDIIIPGNIKNVANYLAQEVLNEKSKV